MARKKDETVTKLAALLKEVRVDARVFGRNDYRRGYIDALKIAIELRRDAMSEEVESKS